MRCELSDLYSHHDEAHPGLARSRPHTHPGCADPDPCQRVLDALTCLQSWSQFEHLSENEQHEVAASLVAAGLTGAPDEAHLLAAAASWRLRFEHADEGWRHALRRHQDALDISRWQAKDASDTRAHLDAVRAVLHADADPGEILDELRALLPA